jgi:magnesium-protoporphyrin O-methyltransferase
LAVEAARLGAEVVAIDLSPTLVNLARERIPADVAHLVEFHSGDMLDKSLGHFDHVVAMDSIIHYGTEDAVNALAQLAERTSKSMVFTFAPRTPMLALMISVGRLLPRGDRAPWLEPMAETRIAQLMKTHESLNDWQCARTHKVSSGFYKSKAMEWMRS